MTKAGQMHVPWTIREDKLLRDLARLGESTIKIAIRMNRSPSSIRAYALRSNICLVSHFHLTKKQKGELAS